MAPIAKRTKSWKEKLPPGKSYPIDDALKLVKEFATAKFNESVDVSVNLGVDATKSDQQVRGSTVMPHGTGKTVRVAVFTQGKNADAAKAAGADIVGFEDLAEKVKAGQIDFDVVIASPDAMRIVGQLGQILGPRGLMPNPKVGTVTPNVAEAVKNAKSGQVRYRTDKAGIIHAQIGRADFEPSALKENLLALVADLQKIKPATSKGIYLKKLTVSSTMGPGVAVDQTSLGLVEVVDVSCVIDGGCVRLRGRTQPPSKTAGGLEFHGKLGALKDSLRRWWDPNQESPGEGRTNEYESAQGWVGAAALVPGV